MAGFDITGYQIGDRVRIKNEFYTCNGQVGVLEKIDHTLKCGYGVRMHPDARALIWVPLKQIEEENEEVVVIPRKLIAKWTTEDVIDMAADFGVPEDPMQDELSQMEEKYDAKIRTLKRDRWERACQKRKPRKAHLERAKWAKTKLTMFLLLLVASTLYIATNSQDISTWLKQDKASPFSTETGESTQIPDSQ